jgi:hypothetical protein
VPPGGAFGPLAVVTLPSDRDSLLEQILPERQKLYRLVRRMLDELDEAAPWEQLYYPPDDGEAFLDMAAALLGVVEQVPARTRELVELLSLAAPDDETRRTLEEAEFYFAGIHSMCAHDLGRLRTLLAPHTAPEAPPIPPTQRNFLCEVAADLKGKYASALMGATASIVAEGTWTGVEVEPVLFPEKAEEFRRNADLARALRRTLDAIGELQAAVPFRELRERWRIRARVDPYALADLATFRGVLGRLLKRDLRRGFYSGDYHQVQRREAALAIRAAALEATHHRTWAEPADAPGAAEAYADLERLTLEVAAVLDVALLEELVGARAVRDLRMAAAAEAAAQGAGRERRTHLAPELEPLVPLLAGEDLKTFVALLLGSVLKRASLAGHESAADLQPGASAAAHLEPPRIRQPREVAVTTAPAAKPKSAKNRAGSGAREQRSGNAGAREALPAIDDALPAIDDVDLPPSPASRRATAATPTAGAAAGERRRETLEQLHAVLLSLQSPENPHWSSVRMLQRLLDRHARIPPSIVQGAHPFVYEVLNSLVPQLELAASFDAVPQEARRRLVECCTALTTDGLSPDQMVDEVPAHLARLHRLLEALAAATAAQLRALPSG